MTIHGVESNESRGWVRWEVLAWLVLLAAATLLRFWDLGARVMTHDESIHAFYAYELLRKGAYVHDPVYHGPLLYHLNALVYFFLGASDAAARVSSALAGVGLVAACWLLRPFIGRAGALAAGLFIALSPTLLFYSRQVWMDVHVALFTVPWIWGALRYLADRGRRWLVLATAAMALAFAAKEVSFIFGAIFGVWLVMEAFASRRADPARAGAAGDLAVTMLALVLPFASGASYLAFGWSFRTLDARGIALVGAHFVAAGLLVWLWIRARRRLAGTRPVTEGRGGLRLRDWVALAVLFWSVEILLFTTLLTNLRGGLATGIVGSLGYWLTQQEVARGSQPWFYYLLLGVLYDLLPLVVGGAAFLAGAARLRRPFWDPAAGDLPPGTVSDRTAAGTDPGTDAIGNRPLPAPGSDPVPDRADRRAFLSLLLWWTLATWSAYLVAGEKMPWLMTHMVLPLCLLAGWGVGRIAVAAGRDRRWSGALVLVGGGLVGPALVARWIAAEPFSGETTQAVAETMEWIVRGGVIAVLAALMLRAALRAGPRQAGRLVALGLAGLLLALTVRAGLRLCYIHHSLATEHLSYAQGSPDVKRAMREIELISERSAGDRDLFVAYDDQSSWPFVWYLRDYPKSRTWGTQPQFAQGAAVILSGPKNRDAAWPLVSSGYIKRAYRLIWWPRQEYASMGPRELLDVLRDPERRRLLWRMAMHRDYSHIDAVKWDPRQEFDMYVREDVAPLGLTTLGAVGAVDVAGTSPGPGFGAGAQIAPQPAAILAGPYDGVGLAQPTDVEVAADGSRILADGGNHRIVVLERDGTLRLAFGSRCDLGQKEGCVDPDGAGPLELGDGQLNEPWGVAAGPSGEIYVSDTWNHRVQRFDRGGRFAGKWGRFGNAPVGEIAEPGKDLLFYGPRGVAAGFDGEVVVADTGNKRLVVLSPAGDLRHTLGSGGVGPDHFDEPVGLATDDNDTLLVADSWNQRVKRIDRRYLTLATWRVPGWLSEAVLDKPYLAVDGAGTIYAGDPEGGRVWVFEASGRLSATLSLPPTEGGKPRPVGLAVDRVAGELLVVDQAGNRVLVYSLPLVEPRRLAS